MKRIVSIIICLSTFFSANAQEIKKSPDARNQELIETYSRDYAISSNIKTSDKPARTGMVVFKAIPNSVMSNADLECYLEVEPTYFREWKFGHPLNWYRIVLHNNSNKTLYIDKSQCWRIPEEGPAFCYYNDLKKRTTPQIIKLEPNETSQLVINSFIVESGTLEENVDDYNFGLKPWFINSIVDGPEMHYMPYYGNRIGMGKRFYEGMVNVGENKTFSYESSPFSVEYLINYYDVTDSSNYKTLDFGFYISQVIGIGTDGNDLEGRMQYHTQKWMSNGKENYPSNILIGYDNKTIVAPVAFYKDKRSDETILKMIQDADECMSLKKYSKAHSLYLKALKSGYSPSGRFYYNIFVAAFNAHKDLYTLEWIDRCFEYDDLNDSTLSYLFNIRPEVIDSRNQYFEQRRVLAESIANAVVSTTMNITNTIRENQSKEIQRKANQAKLIADKKKVASSNTSSQDGDDDDRDGGYEKECPKCGGEGSILIERPHSKMGGALKVKNVHCDICDDDYDANEFDHKHETCPKCKGAKIIKY